MRQAHLSLSPLILAATLLLPAAAEAQDGFGGMRSNGLVRDHVRAGYVPTPDAFTIEGMMAEHHFPVREERCGEAFCVLSAMGHGVHRMSDVSSAYLLVEPVSGDAQQKRAPLDLSIVIDRSGSMSGWKFTAALQAAHAIVDQLGPKDTLSIVTFDDTPTLHLAQTPVRDKKRLHRVIDSLAIGGSTALYEGLAMGFGQLKSKAGAEGRMQRVFVLTDQRPNVGETDQGNFMELVGTWAAKKVGLSVVGVGLDLGTDLSRAMSALAGGSYHYLEGPEGAKDLFANFDALVTPVATTLSLTITPSPGFEVAEVFGVPGDQVSERGEGVVIRAATVFFDTRRSGAVIRLAPTSKSADVRRAHANISWSYTSMSGDQLHGQSEVAAHGNDTQAIVEFEDLAHYRAYALVNHAEMVHHALERWHQGDHAEGRRLLERASGYLKTDVARTKDRGLQKELETAVGLLKAMGER